VDIQYERNDIVLERGKFRVRGDCVEIYPSYESRGAWGPDCACLDFSMTKDKMGLCFISRKFILVIAEKCYSG
jgi:hypothetical protein